MPCLPACLAVSADCTQGRDAAGQQQRRRDTSERIEEYLRTILYSFDNNEQQQQQYFHQCEIHVWGSPKEEKEEEKQRRWLSRRAEVLQMVQQNDDSTGGRRWRVTPKNVNIIYVSVNQLTRGTGKGLSALLGLVAWKLEGEGGRKF